MHVYLAGPMHGLPDHNFPLFHYAAGFLRSRDFSVFNPAESDVPTDLARRLYMRLDLPTLLNCDGVVVLPGWEESIGARLEVHTAVACNMPILRYPDLVRLSPVFELVGLGELV